jgi:hypothetical protein
MAGTRNSEPARFSKLAPLAVVALLAVLSAGAVWFFYRGGQLLWYGDAEAHLNIARRVVDSRTPGYEQLGTVWLPLPHVLMLPFVGDGWLWQSGLAGSFPSAGAYVLAGLFLFLAVRRVFGGNAPAWAAMLLLALNPNLLYLQSTAMTEPLFLACLMALFYFSVRFRDTQGWGALVAAALAAMAATLTRYEGWFVLPFATLYVLFAARRRRFAAAAVFAALAALGPLYWLAYNRYYFGDFLAFYEGPWSARTIQGGKSYPGRGDWHTAVLYYRTAARLAAGAPLFWMGLAGAFAALARRALWPLLLLALPPVFYVWSLHSAGTPIFVPTLWPNTYYNTRYGLALLPLLAFACAALVTFVPVRAKRWAVLALVVAGMSPWLIEHRPDAWVTWKESEVNSRARRDWTAQAARYLGPRYHLGAGIYTGFGDLTAIYRTMGIPLRETLTGDNEPHWMAAFARPDLFLRDEWVVARGGDPQQTVVTRARRPYPNYPNYNLVKTIIVKGAPVIEIYRRSRELEPK